MRTIKFFVFALCILALVLGSAPVFAEEDRDLGLETLPPDDGWAAQGTGTTGGVLAAPDHVYTVHDRKELVAALNDGIYPPPSSNPSDAPKIIYVDGVIDANVDDNNLPLTCADYYRNGYTLDAFLAAYDPAVWGRVPPSGPLNDARLVSQKAQQDRVRIRVGSNTTIVGVGNSAVIRGAWLDLRGSSATNMKGNIIIRNITFKDVYDCFPEWSPTDGTSGAWNALYDAISLRFTNHVWVDHNTFEDDATSDSTAPVYFGVHFEMHDGLLDITNGSDYVTASWNRFQNHDKVMLIGSTDNPKDDRGKLHVTLHHNLFQDLGQRTPRVRFGQVHVFNNYYVLSQGTSYVYSWGVGIESAIYAENNFFAAGAVPPDKFIAVYKGTQIHSSGTYVNGPSKHDQVDVLAAFNAANDPDLSGDVGWTPTLFTEIYPTQSLPGLIPAQAGPLNW